MTPSPRMLGGVLLATFLALGSAIAYWVFSKAAPSLPELPPSSLRYLPAPPSRVILRGPALPGDGATACTHALMALADVSEKDLELLGSVRGEEVDPSTRESLNTLMTRFEPALGELERALSFEKLNLDTTSPLEKHLLSAGHVLTGLAAFKHQLGQDREALNLLLVALQASLECQFWEPWASPARLIESMALDGWRSILSAYSLSSGDLEKLVDFLDQLALLRPDFIHFINLEEQRIRDLLESPVGIRDFAKITGWKPSPPFHSQEAARRQTLLLLSRVAKEMRDFAGGPTTRWMAESNALQNRTYGEAGKLFSVPLVPPRQQLELMAHWALARVATRLAWHQATKGSIPEEIEDLTPRYLPAIPACPFSAIPLRALAGKVWFIAEDLKDNGGKPLDYESHTGTPPQGDLVWKVSPRL